MVKFPIKRKFIRISPALSLCLCSHTHLSCTLGWFGSPRVVLVVSGFTLTVLVTNGQPSLMILHITYVRYTYIRLRMGNKKKYNNTYRHFKTNITNKDYIILYEINGGRAMNKNSSGTKLINEGYENLFVWNTSYYIR